MRVTWRPLPYVRASPKRKSRARQQTAAHRSERARVAVEQLSSMWVACSFLLSADRRQ